LVFHVGPKSSYWLVNLSILIDSDMGKRFHGAASFLHS
jgi:hypothetical protein